MAWILYQILFRFGEGPWEGPWEGPREGPWKATREGTRESVGPSALEPFVLAFFPHYKCLEAEGNFKIWYILY